MPPTALDSTDPYASLKIADFKWFVSARFVSTFGIQMQSVIVGWQVYELTHDALSLGMIGLAEALPFFCVSLLGGHTADKVDRKRIILLSSLIYSICAAALLVISSELQPILVRYGVIPIYSIIFVTGIARGFLSPAQRAFVAQQWRGADRASHPSPRGGLPDRSDWGAKSQWH